MIEQYTIQFLESLKSNNNKDWFDSHRDDYQKARKNFLQALEDCISSVSAFDPSIEAAGLEARRCIMRINRDIRFSKDKTPYKTNFFGVISKGGKKSSYAAYYLHVAPGESFIGAGVYMPPNEVLKPIRQEIDYNLEEWDNIASSPELLKYCPKGIQASGQLKRPPKGYSEDNPALPWLKHKGYYTQCFLTDEKMAEEDAIEYITEAFLALKPMVDFINRALEDLEG